MTLDRRQIMDILPHRDPFLLLDRVIEIIPGVSAKSQWQITGDEYFFPGHFPGMPVLPGVLIIEAMAQTGAVALLSLPEHKEKVGLMTGVDRSRFRRKVVPGDLLVLESVLVKHKLGIGFADCKAYVGEVVVANATISFAVGIKSF